MNKLLIVLVIYENSINETSAFLSLTKNIDNENDFYFFIYDNSPISQLIKTDIKHKYIHDKSNPGVSVAYNKAFEFAINNGFNWVMLSDQDTSYPSGYLSIVLNYLANFNSLIFAPILKENKNFLSPVNFNKFRGIPISYLPSTGFIDFKSRLWPLNSGLIVKDELFTNIFFDDKAKLDFSDFIFIDRVSKKVKSYYLMNITISHSLSTNQKQSLSKLLVRFNYYIIGLKQYSKQINALKRGFLFLVIRSSYLNLKFKTLKFYTNLNEYFKY